jgi:UDP-N-acetylglucosamine 2-epimerase (non-hydrolysing)
MKMRVLVIYGTRPEAIKMAPVVRELQEHSEIEVRVCNTGQHRELIGPIEDFFGIVPDYQLGVMAPAQTPVMVLSKCMVGLEPILADFSPRWVLGQGDTSTVLAAALAAFHSRVLFGHVEAGLRTHNLDSPFPEELNRVLVGRMARLHFAPTELAARNLMAEGVSRESVLVTGNTVIDALHFVRDRFGSYPDPDIFNQLRAPKLVLVTLHRRESFGLPMRNLMAAIRTLALRYRGDFDFVFPMHPNPQVRSLAKEVLIDVPGVHCVEPLAYFDLLKFMARSHLVITDSGGIQEEAPGLGKPVLVCRENTERPEGVQSGVVKLVGCDGSTLISEFERLISDPQAYDKMALAVNPYGDGQAARRIYEALTNYS